MTDTPLAVALAWLDAVDRRDRDTLMALSDPQIEIIGPRGTNIGRDTLGIWFDRVALKVRPEAAYGAGDRVIVLHQAEWHDPGDGSLVGEADAASIFRVAAGRVSAYERDDDRDGILERHGFGEADALVLPAGGPAA
jgi:hypothetical protein